MGRDPAAEPGGAAALEEEMRPIIAARPASVERAAADRHRTGTTRPR
jgi:hypothetical protein